MSIRQQLLSIDVERAASQFVPACGDNIGKLLVMGDGGDGEAGDGVAGDGEVGEVDDRAGLGEPVMEAGHCRDGWLPGQDWTHRPLLMASTTLASRMDDLQTNRSRPVTASQVVFSTVWYTLSGTLMQLGHVHTGSKQSVEFASCRTRLDTGGLEVPNTLFRFERRS